MKAVLLKAPGEVSLEEIPVPEISDDEVLVKVKFCGICGSDVHSIPECTLYQAGTYLGHEFSGTLAKVGKNVTGWKVGDRVTANPMYTCGECEACLHGRQSQCIQAFDYAIGCVPGTEYAGAFAQYVRVAIPEKRLHRLPEGVSFEEGALVEPLACSLHAVRVSAFKPREHVMVLGAGMIGLGVITHLKNAGAGLIIATEIAERRAELASRLGADYVFNPQKEPRLKEKVFDLTGGKGVDVVFDCSGVAGAFGSATNFLKKGGQILLKGVILKPATISPFDWIINEWRLQASMCYYSDEFPMVLEFLKRRISPVGELITRKIKLSDIVKKGFAALAGGSLNEIKILVEPEE
jgi:(R,R)-butanediol dehydrogenase/meso-butanediol dehydrogenase/diacetyl reductase